MIQMFRWKVDGKERRSWKVGSLSRIKSLLPAVNLVNHKLL
jgi:hypothetical protein